MNYQQRANQEKHVRGIITKQLDEIIIEVSGEEMPGSTGHQTPREHMAIVNPPTPLFGGRRTKGMRMPLSFTPGEGM